LHTRLYSYQPEESPQLRSHVRRLLEGEKKKKKKTAEPRYHRLFEYNVHCYLITCSNRAGQQRPASVSSYDVIVQSRGGEVARCGAVRCGAGDPAAFSIAFAAGVTGLYGKVGGLNARPSRSTNWGKPGASRPVNEGGWGGAGGGGEGGCMNACVCGSRRWDSRYRHVWRFAKSARFHANGTEGFRSCRTIHRRFMPHPRAPKAISDRLTNPCPSLSLSFFSSYGLDADCRYVTYVCEYRRYLMRGSECICVPDYAVRSVAPIANV